MSQSKFEKDVNSYPERLLVSMNENQPSFFIEKSILSHKLDPRCDRSFFQLLF